MTSALHADVAPTASPVVVSASAAASAAALVSAPVPSTPSAAPAASATPPGFQIPIGKRSRRARATATLRTPKRTKPTVRSPSPSPSPSPSATPVELGPEEAGPPRSAAALHPASDPPTPRRDAQPDSTRRSHRRGRGRSLSRGMVGTTPTMARAARASGPRRSAASVGAAADETTEADADDETGAPRDGSIHGAAAGSAAPPASPSAGAPLARLPPPYQRLVRVFTALSTIWTFLTARRHVVPTLPVLQTAVGAMLRPRSDGGATGDEDDAAPVLRAVDVARMSTLVPGLTLTWAPVGVLLDSGAREHADPALDHDADDYVLVVDLPQAAAPPPPRRRLPATATSPAAQAEDAARRIEARNTAFQQAVCAWYERHASRSEADSKPIPAADAKAPGWDALCRTSALPPHPSAATLGGASALALDADGMPPQTFSQQTLDAWLRGDAAPVPVAAPLPPDGAMPPPVVAAMNGLADEPFYRGQIVPDGTHAARPQPARYAKPRHALSADVEAALAMLGITQLYTHQADVMDALHDGQHVVVSTPTASGKSLVYQVPILEALGEDAASRAMLIFPTKALAQDQRRSFMTLVEALTTLRPAHWQGLRAAIYDGDVSRAPGVRTALRDAAQVLFTNPDMLHAAILPSHAGWAAWLRHLRYVVVDEVHAYTHAFGAHVALVLRRLRRLCAHYGNDRVQFIACSATLRHPTAPLRHLAGLPRHRIHVAAASGAPVGPRLHAVWNPPWRDAAQPSRGRVSAVDEAARLLVYMALRGIRTICFAKVRLTCELVLKRAHDLCRVLQRRAVTATAASQPHRRHDARDLCRQLVSYRGGYTAAERRQLEQQLFTGAVLGVVATNALELGIDIGVLDCVLHVGFPHTVASYRQQAGRAGRRDSAAASILVLQGHDGRDQAVAQHPQRLFDGLLASPVIDLGNTSILEIHLQCAAAEQPIDLDDPLDRRLFTHVVDDATDSDSDSGRDGESKSESERESESESEPETSPTKPRNHQGHHDPPNRHPATRRHQQQLRQQMGVSEHAALGHRLPPVDDVRALMDAYLRYDPVHRHHVPAARFAGRPQRWTTLRHIDAVCYDVVDVTTGETIEAIERARAPSVLYEGSVMPHQGRQYLILRVEPDARVATARPVVVDYWTSPRHATEVHLLETKASVPLTRTATPASPTAVSSATAATYAHYGILQVTDHRSGYYKLHLRSGYLMETVDQSPGPPIRTRVHGMWIDVPPAVVAAVQHDGGDLEPTLRGAANALCRALPPRVDASRAGFEHARRQTEARHPRPPRLLLFDTTPLDSDSGVAAAAAADLAAAAERPSAVTASAVAPSPFVPRPSVPSLGSLHAGSRSTSVPRSGSGAAATRDPAPAPASLGTLGVAQYSFLTARRLLQRACRLVAACPCVDGCRRCILDAALEALALTAPAPAAADGPDCAAVVTKRHVTLVLSRLLDPPAG